MAVHQPPSAPAPGIPMCSCPSTIAQQRLKGTSAFAGTSHLHFLYSGMGIFPNTSLETTANTGRVTNCEKPQRSPEDHQRILPFCHLPAFTPRRGYNAVTCTSVSSRQLMFSTNKYGDKSTSPIVMLKSSISINTNIAHTPSLNTRKQTQRDADTPATPIYTQRGDSHEMNNVTTQHHRPTRTPPHGNSSILPACERACFHATAQNCARSTQLSPASRKTQCQPPTSSWSCMRSEPNYEGTDRICRVRGHNFHRPKLTQPTRRVINSPPVFSWSSLPPRADPAQYKSP